MWCDDCLAILGKNLSNEAKLVLNALPGTKSETQEKTGLTYALTNRAFIELESALLVHYKEIGRGKRYSLTDDGEKIKDRPKKETIRWKDF